VGRFRDTVRLPNLRAVADAQGHNAAAKRAAGVLFIARGGFLGGCNGHESDAVMHGRRARQAGGGMIVELLLPQRFSGFRVKRVELAATVTEQERFSREHRGGAHSVIGFK
jgi:hypothetical protein